MSDVQAKGRIELARQAIEAWNRVDLDAFLETWHPECEWRPAFPRSTEGVGTVYQGRDGIARAWRGVRDVWEEYRLDPEEADLLGDKLVVVGHVVRAREGKRPQARLRMECDCHHARWFDAQRVGLAGSRRRIPSSRRRAG